MFPQFFSMDLSTCRGAVPSAFFRYRGQKCAGRQEMFQQINKKKSNIVLWPAQVTAPASST